MDAEQNEQNEHRERSEQSLSRRAFLGAAAGTAAAAAIGVDAEAAYATGGHGHGRPVHAEPGDLALVNGRIHTFGGDDDDVVDRVLIRDGKVVALGRDVSLGSRDVKVVDLKHRTVIPGLIDNHVHFIRIGNAVGHDVRQLEVAFSVEDAQEAIAARAKKTPRGEFLTCLAGIARRQFAEGRFPTLGELDDAAPGHPVVISELGVGQTNMLGRDALRGLGVTVGDDGVVANQNNAYAALAQFITHETRKRELQAVSDYSLSIGLTTVMDMHGSTGGAGFLDRVTGHDALLDLVRENTLRVRTRVFIPEQNDPALLQEFLNHRWREYGPDMAKVSGEGEWAPRGANYQTSLQMLAERGWIYHQHLISATEIQNHLNAFREFVSLNPALPTPADLHWNLGHVGDITESQVIEANELGVGIAPHPWRYLTANSGGPNFRMIVDLATVPVGAGLDGARVAPLNPWAGIYFMVTGRNSGGALVGDGAQITRKEAIRLYAGAQQGWFTKEEGLLGGIGVGRFADLMVLRKNFFDPHEVSDDEIRNMASVFTVVNGEVVHDTGVLKIRRS